MDSKENNQPEECALPEGMAREGTGFLWEKDQSPMAYIPEGSFFMGREEGDIFAKKHETPGREVFLGAFYMDLHPVTNRQFRLFIEDKGYENSRWWKEEGFRWKEEQGISSPLTWEREEWNSENQPVAGASWHESMAYAKWAGKSLPTEAEWEKAARGEDGRLFPWGNAFPTRRRANFDGNVGHTTPVGSYPEGKSPYGCLDLAGNVNNWCLDWYYEGFYRFCVKQGIHSAPLLNDVLKRKLGLELSEKVDRGGGFATDFVCFEVLSCTDKVSWSPETRAPWNGFRTVVRMK